MRKISGKLKDMASAQAIESNKVSAIGSLGDSKLSERKIDSNINKRLSQRLDQIKKNLDSISKEISNLQNLTTDLNTFRKSYKKEIVPKLALLDAFRKKYNDRLQIYLMLEDGLSIANYTPFDLAAFFGPGLYTIPAGQEAVAAQSFAPLVDSLIRFSNKYQHLSRTATLIILGFADGQNINPEGSLFITLSNMLGKTDASKEELNKKLSELRAIELIKQLTGLFLKKVPEFNSFEQLKVEYVGQGKGEELPIPTIRDYQENDERRRIVLCYWAVLPNM